MPSYWVVHNSLLVYMDTYGWQKSMSHFASMCCSSPLNPQVLFYDGHYINFGDSSSNILWSHHIQSFILNSGDSLHYHPKYNWPSLKLHNLYDNARMNWMRKHGTLNFATAHMNAVHVET